jgi:hypothetical protein
LCLERRFAGGRPVQRANQIDIMNPREGNSTDRTTLAAIARQAMTEGGLDPDFPPATQQELATISGPARVTDEVRDVRDMFFLPLIKGRLERGCQGLDMGHQVRLKLVHTDVGRGFIDFVRD